MNRVHATPYIMHAFMLPIDIDRRCLCRGVDFQCRLTLSVFLSVFKILILTVVASCSAGELGFGGHGLTLGEIDVGHDGDDIGFGDLGLFNVLITITLVK